MESKESSNPIVSITALYKTRRRSESGLIKHHVCLIITRKDGRVIIELFKPYGTCFCEVEKEVVKFVKDNYYDNDMETTSISFIHDKNTAFSYKEDRFETKTLDTRRL